MRVDVTKDCREITVNAVRFPHQRGAVFSACSPGVTESIAGHAACRTADRVHLISILLEHLAGMDGSPRTDGRFSDRAAYPIQVVRGPLGRPRLLLGEQRGPAISFSEYGGSVWAALSGDGSDIGIDAAGTDEFPSEYPVYRVFHPQELDHALRLTGGDREKASALLWSIKEAVVKALGCAFHLVDPRQITVHPSEGGNGEYTFPVGLSGKALVRFPLAARSLWVRSLPQGRMWLSLARLSPGPADRE
jgi:phosphopantetheinyl transferase (holo-ACP synthase)